MISEHVGRSLLTSIITQYYLKERNAFKAKFCAENRYVATTRQYLQPLTVCTTCIILNTICFVFKQCDILQVN